LDQRLEVYGSGGYVVLEDVEGHLSRGRVKVSNDDYYEKRFAEARRKIEMRNESCL